LDVSNFDEEFTTVEVNSMTEDSLKGKTYMDWSYGGGTLNNEGYMEMEENFSN